MVKPTHLYFFSFFLYYWFVLLLLQFTSAQQNATTDPSEVVALNSVMKYWSNPWSIRGGDPCSESWKTNGYITSDLVSIRCNCSANNGSTCHITELYAGFRQTVGVLATNIGAFTYLTVLELDGNYFRDALPTSIGQLANLESLVIGYNAFSGSIPKELGSLKKLLHLYLGPNNFSGTLPPELGNLINLVEMDIQSCGDVGGEIPSTFANLVNLQQLWISDNAFTGKIPDFIGNWTKLLYLRVEGNSFDSPIPSSFANLVSLKSLRISDLSNASSSLDFIKNMKNLTTLILRNAMIVDSIPSEILGFRFLSYLDLSFNNITGQIPSALFNISSLNYLFLGNNSLFGTLPFELSFGNFTYIDLSYNELSGDLPKWIIAGLQDRLVNIVGNNFNFTSQNLIGFQGQQCLQRTFSCNTSTTPITTEFAIDCGGLGTASDDNKLYYEQDSLNLGAASFYLDGSQTWGVSRTGAYADNLTLNYVQATNDTILNATGAHTSPDLFQTSRSSPGSLRYYGLGLENGLYTIFLMFAELSILDPTTKSFLSLRRRVFDIYIQGRLQIKDFDIAKEAGGVERAVEKKFFANVTENYLEIHLFWAGKGTCCDPRTGNYGPSIAGINAFLNPLKSSRTGLIVGLAVAGVVASLILIVVVTIYIRWKKSGGGEDIDFIGIGPTFSYSQLRNATDDFSAANKLGQGGFGPVYKGLLGDGRPIAVKQLSVESRQGKSEFLAEIAIISAVRHQNLVKLYGCCIEKKRELLVYEYLEKKSLDQALFGDCSFSLEWPDRFKICLGTAKGLAYLHEELTPRIIHRDIKASNILLDSELCPKISDFGLAKLFDDKETHISTRIAGTIGYLAPEYAILGHLTEKADIYGFGIVILEIVSGRSNTINGLGNKKHLLEWVWNLYENDQLLELVDPKLREFDEGQAKRLMMVALWCTQASPTTRPPMSRVVGMLRGDMEVNPVPSKPKYLTEMMFNEATAGSSFLTNDEPPSSVASEITGQPDNSGAGMAALGSASSYQRRRHAFAS